MKSWTIKVYGWDVTIYELPAMHGFMALPPTGIGGMEPVTMMLSNKQVKDSRGNKQMYESYMLELSRKVSAKAHTQWKEALHR